MLVRLGKHDFRDDFICSLFPKAILFDFYYTNAFTLKEHLGNKIIRYSYMCFKINEPCGRR